MAGIGQVYAARATTAGCLRCTLRSPVVAPTASAPFADGRSARAGAGSVAAFREIRNQLRRHLLAGAIIVTMNLAAQCVLGERVQHEMNAKTAGLIALVVWLLGAIFFADFPLTGMISWLTYSMLEAWQLAAFLLAAVAGAWLYRDQSPSRGGLKGYLR
jgi:hypothetical protein